VWGEKRRIKGWGIKRGGNWLRKGKKRLMRGLPIGNNAGSKYPKVSQGEKVREKNRGPWETKGRDLLVREKQKKVKVPAGETGREEGYSRNQLLRTKGETGRRLLWGGRDPGVEKGSGHLFP